MTDTGDIVPFKPARKSKGAPAGAEFDLPDGADIDLVCARLPLNDLGNADRLIKRFGENLLFVEGVGWHAWDDRRWAKADGPRRAHVFAQRTARAIKDEVKALHKLRQTRAVPEEWIDALARHAKASGATGKIAAMLTEAAPHLGATIGDMDQAPYLLNVLNGTLELGAAVTLRPARREDRNTRLAEAEWDDAGAPEFEAFANKILPDEQIRAFVHTLLGYAATGDISEQIVAFFHGDGANGKSTLIGCVTRVLGDYAMPLPIETILHDDRRSGGNATPDLARLPGARLVTLSEPEKGARLSETRIKWLSGGDRMTARNLFKEFIDFYPQFKMLVAMNNKPTVRDTSDGFWRRARLVPFGVKVSKADVERVLKAFEAERNGILRWLIAGVERWFGEGLVEPDAVKVSTAEYRSDSDSIGAFLQDCIVRTAGENLRAGEIYAAYKWWCSPRFLEPVSQTRFGRVVKEKGYVSERVGHIFYRNIALSEAARTGLAAEREQENPMEER